MRGVKKATMPAHGSKASKAAAADASGAVVRAETFSGHWGQLRLITAMVSS